MNWLDNCHISTASDKLVKGYRCLVANEFPDQSKPDPVAHVGMKIIKPILRIHFCY